MRQWLTNGLIGAIVAVVVPASFAMAATPAPTASPSGAATSSPGQGLEISPPVIELSADPGQTVTASIRVRNVASGELIAKGKADDFGAGSDESGKPKLLLNETGATRFSLKYWVQSVPDLTLAPQELKTATITIKVPANAEPGGHFGVIRFTAVPPDVQGTGVALSASVGSLVLLRVSGAVTDKISLAEFSTSQSGHPGSFFQHGPVDFLVRLKNEGSVHEKVQGTIAVTNTFGRKIASVVVNDKGGNVLPDSIRRFDQQLGQKQLFGHYTATLSLTYLNGTKHVNAKLGFWVIPWVLILLILVGLAVLGYLLKLGLKRYNAYIIAQARKR
ncbi:MAG TPA: hypothetical protein VLI05_05435 [Candidatus Saccharimonadia bacterium]|nr:hypothetical protein [Candidatus Saccharimonadia bacterium]